MYEVFFGRRAQKSFLKIPRQQQLEIKKAIAKLTGNPFCFGTIKLINYPLAAYRHRVGDYRILFDIEEKRKMVLVLDIKCRTSTTY
jgi:mRNA interferase RelE/StbE